MGEIGEGSWSQAFLPESVETGNKNRCVTEATHLKAWERLMRFRAFPERVGPQILSLESVDLKIVEKKKNTGRVL